MRKRPLQRPLAAGAAALLVAACGSSPSSPSTSVSSSRIVTGSLVLRVVAALPCAVAQTGGPFIPEVRTRVNVVRSGNEFVGTAASAAAGDVEIRFHEVSVTGFGSNVLGTVKNTAIHMPELVTLALPPWDARLNFGSDGRTSITGAAFTAGTLGATTDGLDGVGSGAVTISANDGRSCSGTTFSWSIAPPA